MAGKEEDIDTIFECIAHPDGFDGPEMDRRVGLFTSRLAAEQGFGEWMGQAHLRPQLENIRGWVPQIGEVPTDTVLSR
jgi:hypothetical protein